MLVKIKTKHKGKAGRAWLCSPHERLVRCLVVNPEVPKAPFRCCCPLADAGAAPGMQEVMAGPQPGAGAAPSRPSGCVVSPGMPPLAGDMGRALLGARWGWQSAAATLGAQLLGSWMEIPPLGSLHCGFVPLGKETTVCSIALAWISRKKAMARGRIAGRGGRGALPAVGGDDKTPHPSPCRDAAAL